jgi:hypothetical protein
VATELIQSLQSVERKPFLEALESLAPDERLGIYRSGGFTPGERTLWAANYPEEVPLVNDEFEWIALGLADLDCRE